MFTIAPCTYVVRRSQEDGPQSNDDLAQALNSGDDSAALTSGQQAFNQQPDAFSMVDYGAGSISGGDQMQAALNSAPVQPVVDVSGEVASNAIASSSLA